MSNLQITLTTPAAATVSLQSPKAVVSSLLIGSQLTTTFSALSDVSAVSPENGDVLQYSTSTGSYVVDSLTIQGGSF